MPRRKKQARHCRGVGQEGRKNKWKEQTEGIEAAEDEKRFEEVRDEEQQDGMESVEGIGDVCVCIEQLVFSYCLRWYYIYMYDYYIYIYIYIYIYHYHCSS
jgi:hypothetical protein